MAAAQSPIQNRAGWRRIAKRLRRSAALLRSGSVATSLATPSHGAQRIITSSSDGPSTDPIRTGDGEWEE